MKKIFNKKTLMFISILSIIRFIYLTLGRESVYKKKALSIENFTYLKTNYGCPIYTAKLEGLYYTGVTIKLNRDKSGYHMVFWGNRKSWFWGLLKDFSEHVNIPYRESKNKVTKLDKKILERFPINPDTLDTKKTY